MKTRSWIYILILATAILAALFLHRRGNESKVTETSQGQPPANVPILAITNRSTTNTAQRSASTNPSPYIQTNRLSLPNMAQKAIEMNNKPIDFYGKVIDQNSNGIPGVTIKAGIRHWTEMDPSVVAFGLGSKEIHIQQLTDQEGRFEISGVSGDAFGISVSPKEGYVLSPKAPRGFQGGTTGSYEDPIIFKMWQLGERQQLVSGSKFWGLVPDGRAYTIDFLQGTKTESPDAPGDIRVSIERPSQIRPRSRFNWSFSMEGIQGGVLKTEDDFMYIAPESGYQPKHQITMNSTNSDWSKQLTGLRFYVTSRNGQVFGRIVFDLIPDYNNVSIFNVQYTMNPNGSRDLQP